MIVCVNNVLQCHSIVPPPAIHQTLLHVQFALDTANLTSCSVIGSSILVSIAGLPPGGIDGPASSGGLPLGGSAEPEPFNISLCLYCH